MKRSCIVTTAVLVAISVLASAMPTGAAGFVWPTKKGKIQNVWVEPLPPCPPVSLHVSVAEPLRLDRLDVNRLSHRFVVKVYWSDPPAGATEDPSLGQCAQLLETPETGRYAVLVMSFYKGMMVDFRSMMFVIPG